MADKDDRFGGSKNTEKLNKIYLTIISRYKDYIEEKENISVAELPTLVTPKNALVENTVMQIKSGFGPYIYEINFYEAAKKAFDLVRDSVEDVSLPLQFWLNPEETLSFMMGDKFDKNILLCSLMICLGNPSSKVFVKIKSDSRNIFVYCEFNGMIHKFDIDDGIKSFESREALIDSVKIDDETAAYEFNDRTFSDIA